MRRLRSRMEKIEDVALLLPLPGFVDATMHLSMG
jgi:hypothetical protein